MFRPVGEVFEDCGVKLKVIAVKTCFCDGCYYQSNACELLPKKFDFRKIPGQCSFNRRGDGKNVIFQRVEQ